MTSGIAIATPHRTATAVGRRVMEAGGSAVDGALAAAAVLTVVYPHNCALGGDLMALVRDGDGVTRAVNATGPAARLVDVDGLRARYDGALPVAGVDTVTVPGLVAGWGELYALGGSAPWAELLSEAERLAREGFAPTAKLLAAIFAAGWRQREASLADPRFAAQDPDAWLGADTIARIAAEQDVGIASDDARPTGDTIALVTRDAEGRAVSLIQSLYWSFGAQLIEPSTGIILQNRGTSFSLDPDHPNVIAPGKRPAHTLMPVLVEREGTLAGVLGTMGGKVQPQIHTQVLLRLLAGATPQEAVDAPRFAVAGTVLGLEDDLDPAAQAALRATGAPILAHPRYDEELGHAQAIWGTSSGTDPRADGL